MTVVAKSGSTSSFLHDEEAVVDYLLKRILANNNRYIGTEWEMFFVKSRKIPVSAPISEINGQTTFAITLEDGQKAFKLFRNTFIAMGYKAKYLHESDGRNITGLEIKGLGTITPEIGHQFEFSGLKCETLDEVKEVNTIFHRAASEVAQRLGYIPVYVGHLPGHAENTEGASRSRSREWSKLEEKFGPEAKKALREALDGTASVQVTVDAGASDFDKFFRALLLIEPALSLHYANSRRSHVWLDAFEQNLPGQVRPIIDVWNATTPKEAVKIIVDRLMEVEVPFLPDPEQPDEYKEEPFINGRPATMKDLMIAGRLSENLFDNVGGFALMRPAFRKYFMGLLEMRGVDSQATPERVGEIANRVAALLYDDVARNELLKAYAHLNVSDIEKLHKASTMTNRDDALNGEIAGVKVSDIVNDIIARSDEGNPRMALRPAYGNQSTGNRMKGERLTA